MATELNGRTLNWNYDNIYRLTNEAVTADPAPASKNGNVAYSLDPVGNRKSIVSSLSGVNSGGTFTFNPDDELAAGQGETYDNNGNTQAIGANSYAYDSQNHLVSMTNGSASVGIVYDALGNRVSKTVNGVTTSYLVDDGFNPTGLPQVMDEIAGGPGSTTVQRTYAYGLQRIDENRFVSGAWTPSFYVYDGGGSVRQLTNSAQTVTDTYDYDAFGNVVNKTGTTPNNYLYRGEQFDADLSLYYLRARYYNPATDRFLSRDPEPGNIAIPNTLHKYLYASGDGVNYVDPTGRAALAEMSLQDSTQTAGTAADVAVTGKNVVCVIRTAASIYAVYLAAEQLINATDAESKAMGGIGVVASLYSLAVVAEDCGAEAKVKESDCGQCFAKGTPVHTSRGDVAIENIHEGDSVISRNAQTGKLEPEPVTALTPLHPSSLLEVRLEGQQAPLRPSINHPFWVKRGDAQDGSWLRADKMQVGDFVQSLQGAWRRVVAITPLPGVETVYNFTVDQNHDYFVGETGFLVHNADCGCGEGPLTILEDPNLAKDI